MGAVAPPQQLTELIVEVEKPEIVKPAEPTPGGSLYLSSVDQVLAYYVESVYFYKANEAKGAENVGQVLKEALSKLLVPYYFFAGRLALNLQQMRMEVDCNGAGVLFSKATTKLSLFDLGDLSLPSPLFRSLILLPREARTLSEAPLITFQITVFRCGGFSIGVFMSHAIVDGTAALNFLNNWCSLARGEGIVLPPNPDRTPLRPRSPPCPAFDHPEYIKLSDLPANNSFTTMEAMTAQFRGTSAPTKHVFKIFPFTAKQLDQLKQKALSDPSISKCSTFDAIAAHVWQARSKSTDASPDQPCNLFFAVDFRSKILPPLPKDYAGNALVGPRVQLKYADIINNSLSFCVKKLQEGIDSVTDEYVRSSVDWWEIYRGVPAVMSNGIVIAAWWKIPFQMLDFGWGKPIYAGPVVNDRTEFILLLANGKNDGGLNVYIPLLPEEVAKFEENIKVSCE